MSLARRGWRDPIRKSRFSVVYQQGASWAGGMLVMKALPNEAGETRLAVAVGKRLGNAVVRNRLKRQLREGLRQVEVAPGWDVIFVAREAAARADYHQLRAAASDLLARAHLLKGTLGNHTT